MARPLEVTTQARPWLSRRPPLDVGNPGAHCDDRKPDTGGVHRVVGRAEAAAEQRRASNAGQAKRRAQPEVVLVAGDDLPDVVAVEAFAPGEVAEAAVAPPAEPAAGRANPQHASAS